jgi:hypothetical protein
LSTDAFLLCVVAARGTWTAGAGLSREGGRRTVEALLLTVVLLALVCAATRFTGAALPDEPGLA